MRHARLCNRVVESPPEPGEVLQGQGDKYVVRRLLREGGTSYIYEVEDSTGARHAAKILSGKRFELNETNLRLFEREVEIQRTITHENIIPVIDVGNWKGRIVPILELASGGSLRDYVDSLRAKGETLSIAEALDIARDMALGIACLHAAGIVHRDVTPKNVLLRSNRRWAITDLGVARRLDDDTYTTADARYGNLIYISAEQRDNPHAAKPADDVFSLGQTLFFMVTMVEPHGNAGTAPERNPDCPTWLSGLIEDMRAFRRSDRPQDGGAVLRRLTATGDR